MQKKVVFIWLGWLIVLPQIVASHVKHVTTQTAATSSNLSVEAQIIEAAKENDIIGLKWLLALPNSHINWQDDTGRTAVMWTAYHGHHKCLRFLLRQRGVDITVLDNTGCNALVLAAGEENNKCTDILLNFHARKNIVAACNYKSGENKNDRLADTINDGLNKKKRVTPSPDNNISLTTGMFILGGTLGSITFVTSLILNSTMELSKKAEKVNDTDKKKKKKSNSDKRNRRKEKSILENKKGHSVENKSVKMAIKNSSDSFLQ